MSWAALFGFLTSALEFCGKLLPGKSAAPAEETDAPAARAGTAAGAAANTASHTAGQAGAKQ